MAKAWDIYPISPVSKPPLKAVKHSSRRHNLRSGLVVILTFIVATIFFCYLGNSDYALGLTLPSPLPAGSFEPTPQPSFSPGLNSENSGAVIIPQTGELKIKILNGSGRYDQVDKVSKLLKAANFTVTETDTSMNAYDQTIIYYQEGYLTQANQMAAILAAYKAKVEPFEQSSDSNLAVIIGTEKAP